MTFYPEDAPVPEGLETDEFKLRMLRVDDLDIEYEAVIASRDILLVYSGGQWPRDNFTKEDDLEDIRRHEAEHLKCEAFTFIVTDPDEKRCLGCVYVNPLLRGIPDPPPEAAGAAPNDVRVRFWMRPDAVEANLDKKLFAELGEWLNGEAWQLGQVYFLANQNERRQTSLYEDAGLARKMTFEIEHKPYVYQYHLYT